MLILIWKPDVISTLFRPAPTACLPPDSCCSLLKVLCTLYPTALRVPVWLSMAETPICTPFWKALWPLRRHDEKEKNLLSISRAGSCEFLPCLLLLRCKVGHLDRVVELDSVVCRSIRSLFVTRFCYQTPVSCRSGMFPFHLRTHDYY